MAETLEWVAPDGAATTLTKTRGASGRYMPPVVLRDDVVPDQHGTSFRSVRFDARQVVVPIFLEGDRATLLALLRALTRAMNPARGAGKLRSTAADGAVRELSCRYVDGLGLEETFPAHAIPSLLFRASDPFWQAAADVVAAFATGAPPTFFPFFPLRLAASTVFGGLTITNAGDVESWPVWTITGPGSNLVLRNITTGAMLSLTLVIAAGETVIIDTRPGAKSVLRGAENLRRYLSGSLWSLAAGDNNIVVELNAVTAASLVSLAYRPRYLTP